jgi:hypothetical protein
MRNAPISRIATQMTMLVSANHAGRRAARLASRIATPANAASRMIVRKALPIIPFASPASTHTTQTRAAAISAPMATQMDARRILLDFGCVMGSLTAAPSGLGLGLPHPRTSSFEDRGRLWTGRSPVRRRPRRPRHRSVPPSRATPAAPRVRRPAASP